MDGRIGLFYLLDSDTEIETEFVGFGGELDEVVLGETEGASWGGGYRLLVDFIMYFHSYSSTLKVSTWYLVSSYGSYNSLRW